MVQKFRCRHCKYEFYTKYREKTTPPNICPYCGECGTVGKKKHVLEEI